ncbi:MAG: hypothetical protein IH627_13070 [Rubrivivax sp.]|nr:hypothetical protein [Rubrivivax sp.]
MTLPLIRPLVLLDFDDVCCINSPYGGYDVFAPDPPPDLWRRLFHPPAVEVLNDVHKAFRPRWVLTTSWLRFMDRRMAITVLGRGGLGCVALNLHEHWDAEQLHGEDRATAILRWMSKHHEGEPYVILDDEESGTGLAASTWHRSGNVVLCREGVGLHAEHHPLIKRALSAD